MPKYTTVKSKSLQINHNFVTRQKAVYLVSEQPYI